MFSIHCLGASQEVGRSAFVVSTDKKLLLDYGIKVFGKDRLPEYPGEINVSLDAALISHAHLDHSGFVPNLYRFSEVLWYSTKPTLDLCEILWNDSMKIMGDELPFNFFHVKKAMHKWRPLIYKKILKIGETEIQPFDAGHICGSAMLDIVYNKKRLFYTGDFKVEETRLHEGAKPCDDVNTLMIDSTYAMQEHPPRKLAEQKLLDEISETLHQGGNVLLPAFSLGRTQELIRLVRSAYKKIPVYVDGLGKEMTRIYMSYPSYLKDPPGFRKDANSVVFVRSQEERKRVLRQPSVIISSAGMLEGGPALYYIRNLNERSKIILTGYSVEGTNGWKLLHESYITINEEDFEIDLPVEFIDLSAHAGRADILNFIKWTNPEKIIIVHSDKAKEFEQDLKDNFGFDAIAPAVGDVVEI